MSAIELIDAALGDVPRTRPAPATEEMHWLWAIRDRVAEIESRNAEIEIAVAQAVEFAQYVEGAARGAMVERARHFLSVPYAKELAARLARCPP